MSLDRTIHGTNMAESVALAFGGNIGDVEESFLMALQELEANGLKNIVASSIYRTAPVNCLPGTPDFLNFVITADWYGDVQSLHTLCKRIEVQSGRAPVREKNSPRTLDIDIILYGDDIINEPDLQIPHIEACNRLFVLLPLEEVAARRIFPGKTQTVADILHGIIKDDEYYNIMKTKRSLFASAV